MVSPPEMTNTLFSSSPHTVACCAVGLRDSSSIMGRVLSSSLHEANKKERERMERNVLRMVKLVNETLLQICTLF